MSAATVGRLCCRHCRIRFTVVAAPHLAGCPECGEPLTDAPSSSLLGFRLFDPLDVAEVLPEALEVSLPVPNGDPT